MAMRFVVPEQKKFVHEMRIPLRWGDMDAMGHINNTLYLRYLEIVRLDWMYGLGRRVDAGAGEGPLIVNAFVNFLQQLEFPGELIARQYVANPGRSSVDTFVTLARTDAPAVVCAEGGATMVWTDYAAKKSAPMPDWFRALVT